MRDNFDRFWAMSVRARALQVLGVVLFSFALRVAFAIGGGDEIAWGLTIASSLATGAGAALFMIGFTRRR